MRKIRRESRGSATPSGLHSLDDRMQCVLAYLAKIRGDGAWIRRNRNGLRGPPPDGMNGREIKELPLLPI